MLREALTGGCCCGIPIMPGWGGIPGIPGPGGIIPKTQKNTWHDYNADHNLRVFITLTYPDDHFKKYIFGYVDFHLEQVEIKATCLAGKMAFQSEIVLLNYNQMIAWGAPTPSPGVPTSVVSHLSPGAPTPSPSLTIPL